MSNQLTISATLSVLMMSIYVLFGTDSGQNPVTAENPMAEARAALPGLPANPGQLLPILR